MRVLLLLTSGKFRLGVHYTKPNGGRPVFAWQAVQAWIKGERQAS